MCVVWTIWQQPCERSVMTKSLLPYSVFSHGKCGAASCVSDDASTFYMETMTVTHADLFLSLWRTLHYISPLASNEDLTPMFHGLPWNIGAGLSCPVGEEKHKLSLGRVTEYITVIQLYKAKIVIVYNLLLGLSICLPSPWSYNKASSIYL